MKIDMTQTLKNFDGSDMEGAPVLRDVVTRSLVELSGDDHQRLSGQEKFMLGMLAHKVNSGGDAGYSIEEMAKIKERVGVTWSPLVVTWVWSILENKS